MMKSTALALAAILATTANAWATSVEMSYDDLIVVVQRASHDPVQVHGLLGSSVDLDLRPNSKKPYYRALSAEDGLVFICQTSFDDFAGGPIKATLSKFELGDDGADFLTLSGCTA